ncbi:MAG: hypothetical protein IT376_12400 [Polyangiaceae bacterium]|nr:hypothetical protein [Polyangiaceae bacterium]
MSQRARRCCEICESLRQATGALVTSRSPHLFRVVLADRVLWLCEEHSDEVCATRAGVVDELRLQFLEPFPGRRSLIPRRSPFGPEHDAPRRAGRRSGEVAPDPAEIGR